MVFTPPPDLSAAMRALRQNLARADMAPEAFEEKLLGVLASTLILAAEHSRLAERIPARRAATRRRLLSQLQRAREMIEDCAERPPDLTQLAEASALSKFHLLRLFAETFGATPLEYAQLRRVERAKDLLRSGANGTKTLKYRDDDIDAGGSDLPREARQAIHMAIGIAAPPALDYVRGDSRFGRG